MCCALLLTQPQIFTQIEIIISDSKPALITKKKMELGFKIIFFPSCSYYVLPHKTKRKEKKKMTSPPWLRTQRQLEKIIYTLQDQVRNGDTA